MILGAVVCPVVLMMGRIAEPIVQRYAAQVSLSLFALLLTLACTRERPLFALRHLAFLVAGLGAVAALS